MGVYPPFCISFMHFFGENIMRKKIITFEDGKQIEAYLKLAMMTINDRGEKELVGVAYAGTRVACRAIHASLYSPYVEIHDEETGSIERLATSREYRRIEEVNGKVTHVFALPRSVINNEYKKEYEENIKNGVEYTPEKIIMTKGNLTEEIGHFLANTFGLPKTREWLMKYEKVLPFEKVQQVNIETTDIAGELKGYKAQIIKPLTEEEMLSYIEVGIRQGIFKTRSENNKKNAIFKEDWSTEDYLRANTELLVSKIDQYTKPLYDGSYFSRYIAETNRISVPAQARAVMGLNAVLREKIGAFLVGMMGTGKTQISLTTAYVRAKRREESGAEDGFRSLIVA